MKVGDDFESEIRDERGNKMIFHFLIMGRKSEHKVYDVTLMGIRYDAREDKEDK